VIKPGVPCKEVNTGEIKATNRSQSLGKGKEKTWKNQMKQASKRLLFFKLLRFLTNLIKKRDTQPLEEQSVTVNLAGE